MTSSPGVLDTIYEAALDPARWPGALESVVHALGGSSASLVHAYGTGDIEMQMSVSGVDAGAHESYNRHYGRLDQVMTQLPRLRAMNAFGCYDLVRREDLLSGEFYADWMRKADLGDGVFFVLGRDETRTTCLAVGSPMRPDTFVTPERRRRAGFLASHVRRAVAIHTRVAAADAPLLQFAGAEHLQQPVAIVARDGRVLHCTAPFVAAVEQARMTLFFGRLRAATFRDQAQVDRALSGAALGDGMRSGSTVTVGSPASRPLVLHVLPIGEGLLAAACPEARALVVVEPSCRPPASAARLREAFGLTEAEAAVAALLVAETAGLRAIAGQLGVALSTVRTHLRHIFEKTGTHRQVDLVALLMSANDRHPRPRAKEGASIGGAPCALRRPRR